MPRLEIKDKTGDRTIIQPAEIAGVIWMDDSYCGQFLLYEGADMVLINRAMKVEVILYYPPESPANARNPGALKGEKCGCGHYKADHHKDWHYKNCSCRMDYKETLT